MDRVGTHAVMKRLAARGVNVERSRLWRISDRLQLATRTTRGATRSWSDEQIELLAVALTLRQSRRTRLDLIHQLATTTGGTADPLVDRLRLRYAEVCARGGTARRAA